MDKIKKPKEITDKSAIITPKESDLTQCPRCLKLSHIGESHKCDISWKYCSICGVDLHKKPKEIHHNGRKYTTFGFKKYFRIIHSLICYECAIKITRMVKKDTSKTII